MKISVDAMGGDNAPRSVVEGCISALERGSDFTIQLVGDQNIVEPMLKEFGYTGKRIELIHATQVIDGTDIPTKAIKEKKDSSIVVGLNLLKEKKTDSFLSCGNTGALLTGAMLISGRIKGIDRPALAPVIPTVNGKAMLIDAGLNSTCKLVNYLQFAELGTVYMREMFKLEKPRIGLLNVGTEENKGPEVVKEAYRRLSELNTIHFVGNVEGRDLIEGACDIAVCDGFVGNIVLKCYEGIGAYITSGIKDVFMRNIKSKLAASLIKDDIKAFFKQFDYEDYGGTPILGINGSVFKGHGSSKGKSVMYAVECAVAFSKTNTLSELHAMYAK